MNRSVIAVIVFIAFFNFFNARAQTSYPVNPDLDVLHYTFAININDTSNKITGKATIQFTLKEQQDLILDLINVDSDGKGMKVDEVTSGDQSLRFEHNNDRLHIDITSVLPSDSLTELSISYGGIPAGGLIIGLNKFNEKVFFGDNYPDRARNWLPCVDHPADKATVTWVVTAPSHYRIVGSGRFVGEVSEKDDFVTTTWDEQAPISTKVMVFGAANFAVDQSGNVSGVPVSTWVYKQNSEAGFHDFAIAPKVLAFYDSLIYAYPYEKLANVQSRTTYGGMENAGNIFYFENSVNGKGEREDLIAHEIVHQWFGNSATEADWPHAWLSEGFATYLTHVYVGDREGQEEMNKRLKANRERIIKYWQSNPLPIVNFELVTYPQVENLRELLSTNTYDKGGWVLHMLRQELGDEDFWQAVRQYYSTYKNSNATTADLRRVMEEVSNRNLRQFFNQWLYGIGQPLLVGEWSYAKKKISVTIRQNQDNLFDFSLEIGLVYGDKVEVKEVDIAGSIHTYSFAGKKPDRVIIDPNTKLLFEGELELVSK